MASSAMQMPIIPNTQYLLHFLIPWQCELWLATVTSQSKEKYLIIQNDFQFLFLFCFSIFLLQSDVIYKKLISNHKQILRTTDGLKGGYPTR